MVKNLLAEKPHIRYISIVLIYLGTIQNELENNTFIRQMLLGWVHRTRLLERLYIFNIQR